MKILPEGGHRPLVVHRTLLAAVLCCVAFFSAFGPEPTNAESTGVPASVQAKDDGSAKEEAESDFAKLKGRWRRPDGGYVIEIKDVDPVGKMDAGYFNPRPINVAKAEATREGSTTKIFIELRDAGYPGSTYTLTYNPQSDQLKGDYFQATIQQHFEVVFIRMM
jgi:hypothetical protein